MSLIAGDAFTGEPESDLTAQGGLLAGSQQLSDALDEEAPRIQDKIEE